MLSTFLFLLIILFYCILSLSLSIYIYIYINVNAWEYSRRHFMFYLNGTRQSFYILTLPNILDRSLNITFIQLSTRYVCFFSVRFNFVFFCLCFNAGFRLVFVNVNPISLNWFLTNLTQKLIPLSTQYFFIISSAFSTFQVYCFEFSGRVLVV